MTAGNTSNAASGSAAPHATVRPEWLALRNEAIIEPERLIVDPHHHLWDRPGARYLALDLLDDVTSGHRIAATVFIQSRSMLRAHGDPAFATLGEVEFANGAAAMGASGIYGDTRICAGIVGAADLALGDAAAPVLEAMVAISGGRLRGIRNSIAWHDDASVASTTARTSAGMLLDPKFAQGAALLSDYGLALDVWAYHTQLDECYELARRIPDVTVVIDHFGGPVGVGRHAATPDAHTAMLADWRASMQRLASLPNTRVKLGGGGMPVLGFHLDRDELPPASELLADILTPYVETCIELFGVTRCMFESNFPVDKGMFSYHVLWNAFKRIAASASEDEKRALFSETAATTYRLEVAG
ncbi:amidohydrolase family protein [Paraburkholderia sp. ZP32-5]|uniref:amidohydrolase family protein n=1 Tax=Paraburkholderia sp. ZP32-5 TaxID=2883245 RepID=UPI001F363517|nr:amidohydrolase family protein [Paraburkholderia sp. ZP32-5]